MTIVSSGRKAGDEMLLESRMMENFKYGLRRGAMETRRPWLLVRHRSTLPEGNGRWHKGEKRQFFWIARGSTFECVPIIQVLQRKSLINEQQYAAFYEQLDIIAKMLTNLVKSVEELKQR